MTDPILARQIDLDRQIRAALGTLSDFAHATDQQILDACDLIDRHSCHAGIRRKAEQMRALVKYTPQTAKG